MRPLVIETLVVNLPKYRLNPCIDIIINEIQSIWYFTSEFISIQDTIQNDNDIYVHVITDPKDSIVYMDGYDEAIAANKISCVRIIREYDTVGKLYKCDDIILYYANYTTIDSVAIDYPDHIDYTGTQILDTREIPLLREDYVINEYVDSFINSIIIHLYTEHVYHILRNRLNKARTISGKNPDSPIIIWPRKRASILIGDMDADEAIRMIKFYMKDDNMVNVIIDSYIPNVHKLVRDIRACSKDHDIIIRFHK